MKSRQVIEILPDGTRNVYNTQAECSAKTGIHYTTLNMILTGKRKQLKKGPVYQYGGYSVKKSKEEKETQFSIKSRYVRKSVRKPITQTKCWHCKNSYTNGCSWAREFKPVEGWKAVPTSIGYNPTTKSYQVISCPEFVEG